MTGWLATLGTITPRGDDRRETEPARRHSVQEDQAERIVATLRERRVMAHTYSVGVYQYGIRVVIPDGREAIWDADGAAGLEATVMRDGVLVGMIPTIAGSESFDDERIIAAISTADYGQG